MYRKIQDQEQRQPEVWHTDSQHGQNCDKVIQNGILPCCRNNTCRNSNAYGKNTYEAGDLKGNWKANSDLLCDRLPRRIGNAQVSAEKAGKIFPIAFKIRARQPKLLTQFLNGLFRGFVTKNHSCRISGREIHHRKNNYGNTEKNRYHDEKTLYDKFLHNDPLPDVRDISGNSSPARGRSTHPLRVT